MLLSKRLAALREKSEKSLQEVADLVGVSKTHIWSLEKGQSKNPSLDLLKRLAKVFNVPVEYLAGTLSESDKTMDEAEATQFFRKFSQLTDKEREVLQETLATFLKKKPKN